MGGRGGGLDQGENQGSMTGAEVIIPTRRILKRPRQTATMTLDEVTMGKGHRGRDLSSTPVKLGCLAPLGISPAPDTGPRSNRDTVS